MTAPFAHVAGNPLASATIHVPWSGAWFADLVFLDAPDLSGAVELVVGNTTFRGTIDDRFAGTRGQERRARIVGGSAGWGAQVPAKSYVNDQGVRALLVAQDAARAAGETLGAVSPSAASLGAYYVRQAGPAAQALEDVIGSASWWVEYDGTTSVGTRPMTAAREGTFEVLEYDALGRIVTLGADDVSAITVGSVLSGGILDASQTVRDLEIRVTPEAVRFIAWTGQPMGARGRLEGAFRELVARSTGDRLFGTYRYRVARRVADRLELQAINPALGLPDLGPTPMWPGVAGVHAELALGAEVLVSFIDGDRTQPIVSAYVGKGGPGFVPQRIDVGASPTDYVALASKVLSELQAVKTAFDSHTHPTPSGASSAPTAPMPAPSSVASALVRST